MPEIRFKLSPELETILVKEQQSRKQTLSRSPPLAALAQEYILKGLLSEGKSVETGSRAAPSTHRDGYHQHQTSLEDQARQMVHDRLEVLELATKAQAILAENISLQAEVQSQARQLAKATNRIRQLKRKQTEAPEAEPPVFLGLTTKELLLVGIPTALLLFQKYSNGKADEVIEQLSIFKQNISKLPDALRKEALQLLSHDAIPWPKDLKAEVFQALGAN